QSFYSAPSSTLIRIKSKLRSFRIITIFNNPIAFSWLYITNGLIKWREFFADKPTLIKAKMIAFGF
uniref:Uncharacterized protein n=1 Tax=Glossina palpalis gambiensis TaxID=67801 RepID=A0A1B0AL50_9MUSC